MSEPEKPKIVSRGFVIAIIVLIILFLTIALPSFIKARNTSAQNACINNLRIIDAGKYQSVIPQSGTNAVSEKR